MRSTDSRSTPRDARGILTACILALVFAGLAFAPTAAAHGTHGTHSSRTPSLSDARSAPSQVRVIQPWRDAGLRCRGGAPPSDVHAYDERGRGYVEHAFAHGQTAFTTRNGREVVGWDGVNGDAYSFAHKRPVIVAIWCES